MKNVVQEIAGKLQLVVEYVIELLKERLFKLPWNPEQSPIMNMHIAYMAFGSENKNEINYCSIFHVTN